MGDEGMPELTEAMKELLVRAYRAGDQAAQLLGRHDWGEYVRVGGENLDDDRARRQLYVDALRALVAYGFMGVVSQN